MYRERYLRYNYATVTFYIGAFVKVVALANRKHIWITSEL